MGGGGGASPQTEEGKICEPGHKVQGKWMVCEVLFNLCSELSFYETFRKLLNLDKQHILWRHCCGLVKLHFYLK